MSFYDLLNNQMLRSQLPATIGPASPFSIGTELANYASAAPASQIWTTANTAVYIPFLLPAPQTIVEIAVRNGAAVSGNIDVGIMDENLVRLVSKGTTAQAGTNAIQVFDITDTYLKAGFYFLGVSMDNITGTLFQWNLSNTTHTRLSGVVVDTAAFPIPASAAAAAACTTQYVPVVALSRFAGRFA